MGFYLALMVNEVKVFSDVLAALILVDLALGVGLDGPVSC